MGVADPPKEEKRVYRVLSVPLNGTRTVGCPVINPELAGSVCVLSVERRSMQRDPNVRIRESGSRSHGNPIGRASCKYTDLKRYKGGVKLTCLHYIREKSIGQRGSGKKTCLSKSSVYF